MTDSPSTPLPQSFTPLIGRERDIDAISNRLRSSGGAIVTLVGSAGVGKTRLAIAVAEAIGPEFEQGVVFVDLAQITNASQVLPLIGATLGLPETDGAAGQLARYLSARSLLLVLDNFEQVADAGPALNASLAGAPGVRTLVTSQRPLRVRGEQEYTVEPLLVPAPLPIGDVDSGTLETYRANPSVQLFTTRAQSVRASFQLTTANLPAVVSVCRYLDGIPLAIELAAARSNVLSPEALLNRLTGSLHLLSGGPRDAPNRHQTLRAAIEWSYGLLDPREARLLDRLSIFAGDFSLPAAEAIAANAPIRFEPSFYIDANPDLPEDDGAVDWMEVFELLDALVHHSLVQQVETNGEHPRFRLYQTIRQVVAEKLAERGEFERVARRHATWFRALAESGWSPDGVALLEGDWLDRLDADYENVRAALDYLTDTVPGEAVTMASSLVWYYYIRSLRMDGIRAIERVADVVDWSTLSAEAHARTEFSLGNLLALFPLTRHEGVAKLESVLEELRALGHHWGVGYTLIALAVLFEDDGEYERALEFIAQARPLLDEVDDQATLANVDFHTAVSLFGLGRLAEARALTERVAGGTIEESGLNIAYALHLLGMIDLVEGKNQQAARHFRESANFSVRHGIIATATELLDCTATLQETRGDAALVARLFGAADRHNQETGNPITYPERIWYDAARDRARTALGIPAFQEQLAAGAALSIDAAFALMREVLAAFETDEPAEPPLPALPIFGTAQPFGLTNRELDVLRLVAMGMSDREIADTLFISHGTARTHVRNILGKMEVPNRSAATSIALREQLVDLSEAG